MLKRAAAFAAATVAVTGLTVINPTAAFADTSVSWSAGTANFVSDGDLLRVTDNAADGWGTRAQIQVKTSTGGYTNYGSVCFDDTNQGHNGFPYTQCNFNLAEGTVLRVKVWASNGGATKEVHVSGDTKA